MMTAFVWIFAAYLVGSCAVILWLAWDLCHDDDHATFCDCGAAEDVQCPKSWP